MSQNRRRRIGMGAAAAAAVLLAAVLLVRFREREEPVYLLRYADNQPETYPTAQGGLYFAELVKQRTEGRVEIRVYADGALGNEASVIRQVKFGGIDMARVSAAELIQYEPVMGVLSLPFLYGSEEHMWRVLDGPIGEEALGMLEGSGLEGLSWYDAGTRNFYTTKRMLKSLEDLKGMKLRVQEAEYMSDLVTALGAVPKSLPYSLVYSSLSLGEVEGAENNWPSYETSQHYKVARYLLEDEHMRIPELQILSRKTEETLPEQYREIIRECARESAVYERGLWREQEAQSRERMIKAGTVVTSLSAEEKERFRQACQPMYEKYGAGYEDMIRQIQELETAEEGKEGR